MHYPLKSPNLELLVVTDIDEKMKGTDYAEKLRSLLDRNKQIIKDLEAGKLTTAQASERVNSISSELKKLTDGHSEKR